MKSIHKWNQNNFLFWLNGWMIECWRTKWSWRSLPFNFNLFFDGAQRADKKRIKLMGLPRSGAAWCSTCWFHSILHSINCVHYSYFCLIWIAEREWLAPPPNKWKHSLRSFIHFFGAPMPVNNQSNPFFPLGRKEWNCFWFVEWAAHVRLLVSRHFIH